MSLPTWHRWGAVFGPCLFGFLTSGCCDECRPDTFFGLPLLSSEVEQQATVEFAKSRGGRPSVTCAWTSGPDWSCDPPPRETGPDGRGYHFDEAWSWFVRLSGPTGTRVLERSATSDDPGEGVLPLVCPLCYDVQLGISAVDLELVGVDIDGPSPPAPPTFGEICSVNSECDPSLFCGPTAAMPRTCTSTCDRDADCPAGAFCNDGYCAPAP